MEIVLNSIEIQLNAESENKLPTQIKLLPKSPVTGRDGRKFTYDINTVLAGFKKHAQELPIDVDHASEIGFTTAASGWIKSLEAKKDGVYGNVEWNSRGQQLLGDKIYKYISPAFYANDNKEIQHLSSAALTNHPNFKMPSLNSKQNQQGARMDSQDFSSIAAALDLPTNADAGVIINSIHKIKLNQIDKEKFILKADYDLVLNQKNQLEAELNKTKAEELTKEANSVIDKAIAQGRITASSKDYYLNNCSTKEGLEQTKVFLNGCTPLDKPIFAGKADNKGSFEINSLSELELNSIKDTAITVEEYMASKKLLSEA